MSREKVDFDPYIPPYTCGKCFVAPMCIKNDVSVSVRSRQQYYYTINADLWACPICKEITITGFARAPIHCYLNKEAEPPADFVVELNPESLIPASGVTQKFNKTFDEIMGRFKGAWERLAKT